MMGLCGLDCVECRCFKGTVSSDLSALAEVAKKWSTEEHPLQAMDMLCLGCTQEDGRLVVPFCRECRVRSCAFEKRVATCAVCSEFDACEKLHDLLKFFGDVRLEDKMKLLRAKVLAS
jgi:hypothetical protein